MKTVMLMIACVTAMLCANAQQADQSLDAKSFQAKLASTPDAVLLDVRTPEEVSKGFISGAVNIDFNAADFAHKISGLDKSKTYFVYCAKGGRSSQAVELMNKEGFTKLYNLSDGFAGWKQKRLPITKK